MNDPTKPFVLLIDDFSLPSKDIETLREKLLPEFELMPAPPPVAGGGDLGPGICAVACNWMNPACRDCALLVANKHSLPLAVLTNADSGECGQALLQIFCPVSNIDRNQLASTIKEITKRWPASPMRALPAEPAQTGQVKMDGFFLVDANLNMLWCDQIISHKSGIGNRPAKGSCHQLLFGRSRPCPDCMAMAAMQSGHVESGDIVRPNAHAVRATASPIPGCNGKIEQVAVQIRNAVQSQGKPDRRKRRDSFAKLFKNSPVAIMAASEKEGRLVEVNNAFSKITGYSRQEAVGKTTKELNLWHEWDKRKEALELMLLQGGLASHEVRFRMKNGEARDFLMSSQPIDIGATPCIISVLLDITEKNRLADEKESMEMRMRMDHKLEALGAMAGGIAHDFNNIVMSIIGYTEMALEGVPEGRQAYKDMRQVLKAGKKARDLARKILTFGKRNGLQRRPVVLEKVVGEALEILGGSVPPNIKIEKRLSGEQLAIMADPTELHQVVVNLCTNAIHAIGEKQGSIQIVVDTVDISPEQAYSLPGLEAGPHLLLKVSDTGCGIPKGIQEQIFDPYFSTKPSDQGSGLGLPVVMGIVTSHGGAINAESRQGRGSAFNIYLPL